MGIFHGNKITILIVCCFVAILECYTISDRSPSDNVEAYSKRGYACPCEPLKLTAGNENKTSILKMRINGRLGNKMLGYAMTLVLKRVYGFRTFLEPHVRQTVNYYFERATEIPSIDHFCHDKEYNDGWFPYLYGIKFLNDTKYKLGRLIDFVPNARLMNNNVNSLLEWDQDLLRVEEEIRRTFIFREAFLREAQSRIQRTASMYMESSHFRRRKKKKVELTFVGVHVRKTDADKKLVQLYNMPQLNPSYYIRAMDVFMSNYKNTVFILTTDDLDWIHQHLMPRLKNFPVYVMGTAARFNQFNIGVDMALMSLCNHTILSYGTYSFWSGFLAGGQRIIPSMIFKKNGNPLDQSPKSVFSLTDEGLVYYSDKEIEEQKHLILSQDPSVL